MASRRNQILAASAIWIAVCGLGWHAYANIFPKYGLVRRSTTTRANPGDWQALQKEQQDFYKLGVPWWTRISVKKAPLDRRMNMGGWPHEEKGAYYFFANGQTIGQAYASIAGIERWQISELPKSDQRYDIRIRAAASEKKKIPAAFLKDAGYSVRQMASAMEGYRFTAGSPPANPSPPDAPGQQRRMGNIPPMRLSDARGMIANRVNSPVEIDKSVRDKKPDSANLQINWGLPPEKFAQQIASIFGVAMSKTTVETTSVLVYQPKLATPDAIQQWTKEGKL